MAGARRQGILSYYDLETLSTLLALGKGNQLVSVPIYSINCTYFRIASALTYEIWSNDWHFTNRLHRWSLGMDKSLYPTFYQACVYLSMLGLKLNQVDKWGLRPRLNNNCGGHIPAGFMQWISIMRRYCELIFTLGSQRNARNFADGIFKTYFVMEYFVWMFKLLLTFGSNLQCASIGWGI